MALPKKPLSGVYAIFLKGTPYVYVGEGKDVASRWRRHRDMWAWPNDVEYVLVREMPQKTQAQRRRTESALARLLVSRGYLTLSKTREEVLTSDWRAAVSRATAIKHNALRGKEALREMGRQGAAAWNAKRGILRKCKYGHRLTKNNLYIQGTRRICKKCHRARARRYYHAARVIRHG